MNRKVKLLISVFGSVLIAVPLYIFLHEGGHALVALLCGARITSFSILGAHTSWVGGSFSSAAAALTNAAGMLLPALVYAGSILAWVLVPILCLAGHVPAGDDVAKFLQASGWHPAVVMALSLALFGLVLGVAWRWRILQNYWTEVNKK